MSALLEVEGLTKRYRLGRGLLKSIREVRAVDGVSLALEPGETFALVGESGSGKTTLGRCVLRLIEPDAGQVRFRNKDILSLDRRAMRGMRRHLQMVFQDPYSSLNPRHTVGKTLSGVIELHGLARGSQARERAQMLLERVGLQARYVDRFPHEFSGGQRQRIGIARAIAAEPQLIVADEPVSALDVSVQAQIINLMLELQEQMKLGYVFIAHDLAVVRHIANTVAVMYLGSIVESAPRKLLFESPFHPYTQALLAASPEPRPGRRRARVLLRGEAPSPTDPPVGCAFSTRCPLAQARCRLERPTLMPIGGDAEVACHLYADSQEPVLLSDQEEAKRRIG